MYHCRKLANIALCIVMHSVRSEIHPILASLFLHQSFPSFEAKDALGQRNTRAYLIAIHRRVYLTHSLGETASWYNGNMIESSNAARFPRHTSSTS
jgi:hypothetical protein